MACTLFQLNTLLPEGTNQNGGFRYISGPSNILAGLFTNMLSSYSAAHSGYLGEPVPVESATHTTYHVYIEFDGATFGTYNFQYCYYPPESICYTCISFSIEYSCGIAYYGNLKICDNTIVIQQVDPEGCYEDLQLWQNIYY